MHYFTELGEINKCENKDGGGNGSYVQIGFRLTQFPLLLPFGFCLPEECSRNSEFEDLVIGLNEYGNQVIEIAKEYVDFDKLYDMIPEGTTNANVKIKAITNLAYNGT